MNKTLQRVLTEVFLNLKENNMVCDILGEIQHGNFDSDDSKVVQEYENLLWRFHTHDVREKRSLISEVSLNIRCH